MEIRDLKLKDITSDTKKEEILEYGFTDYVIENNIQTIISKENIVTKEGIAIKEGDFIALDNREEMLAIFTSIESEEESLTKEHVNMNIEFLFREDGQLQKEEERTLNLDKYLRSEHPLANALYDKYLESQGIVEMHTTPEERQEMQEESYVTNENLESSTINKIEDQTKSEQKGYPWFEEYFRERMNNPQTEEDLNLINVKGNLVGDPEIKDIVTKDNETVRVANFAVAYTDYEKDETIYHNCEMFEDKTKQVENMKKGDFIEIFGELKTNISQTNQKEYTKVRTLRAKLLKSLEEMKKERENHLSVKGNLIGDPEIKDIVTKDNRNIQVARFAIVSNNNEENPIFYNCEVFENKVKEIENMKKGDFVKVSGELKTHVYNDKEYARIIVAKSELLKSLEEMKEEKENTLTLKGNLISDPEIKTITTQDNREIQLAKFVIAGVDELGEKSLYNCDAYEDKAKNIENMKKGDFIKVTGVVKTRIYEGKEYKDLKVKDSKLLKAKAKKINKDSSKDKGMDI